MTSPPMTAVDLAALADAGDLASREHRTHLEEVVGIDDWDLDTTAAHLGFTDASGRRHDVRAHFVGSASPQDGTWLWAWENVNGFPAPFVRQARRVRELGEREGIPQLATATLPLTPALPVRLLGAVAALTGLTAAHPVPTGNGDAEAWLLLDDAELALPAPTVASTLGLLTAALADDAGPVDHRRALTGWTRLRDVDAVPVSDDVVELALTDGPLQVRFDAARRIAGLGGRLVPRTEPSPEPQAPPAPPPAHPAAPQRPSPAAPPRRRGLLDRLLGRP